MDRPVVIVDPDPAWPAAFATLRDRILPVFAGMSVTIEHVGSTAVPGLAAKPIIDLVIVIPGAADLPSAIDRLATLGYRHEGDLGIPGRDAFRGEVAGPAHHLYVSPADSPSLAAHLAFRDALRADPALVAAYADLKRELAAAHNHDREAYTEGKTTFVTAVLATAAR